MEKEKMKKWQIKNFYLTFKGGPIEAKTKEEASEQITKAILAGEFEFDVEEI